MDKRINLLSILAMLFVSGCSVPISKMPGHMVGDNKSRRSIGFEKRVIAPNLYHLSYTVPAISVMDSYANTWKKWYLKAQQICDNESFQTNDKYERKWTDSFPGWLQTVSAEIDCTGNAKGDMQKNEVMVATKEKEELKQIAIEPVCQNAFDSDLYSLAERFYKYSYYKEAMTCFLKIIEVDPQNSNAILHIGMMYEFGYGVEVDIDTAKSWYLKIK
jgi:tetratricopeptide (TPR) repeat protein